MIQSASENKAPVIHSKYCTKGAYHWAEISNNIGKFNCFTSARYQIALDLAGEFKGKKVLDFGCGDGAFLSLASKGGGVCIGFEPDDNGRRFAREQFAKLGLPIEVVDSVEALEPESFDLIFLLEVIEHVKDPEGLLATCLNLLAPGGLLVITTPTRLTETPLDAEHVREFFPTEFFAMLRRFFQVEQSVEKLPLAAVELYLWAPKILFNKPVMKWLMNLMAVVFKKNPLLGIDTLARYHTQLGARCRKKSAT